MEWALSIRPRGRAGDCSLTRTKLGRGKNAVKRASGFSEGFLSRNRAAHAPQEELHVLPHVALFLRAAVRQQERRVIGHEDGDALVIVEPPAQLAHRLIRVQQSSRGAST